jgi:hypothetical protein
VTRLRDELPEKFGSIPSRGSEFSLLYSAKTGSEESGFDSLGPLTIQWTRGALNPVVK